MLKNDTLDNIAKIDLILNLIIKCDKPPRLSDGDIHEQLKKINIDISSKEIIEILDKLVKDGFVIKDIQHSSIPGSLNDNVAYYFSSFEGRENSQTKSGIK